jgi:hypothetical protein
VNNWTRPIVKHQLRSFLGLSTYYRRFISRLANITKPLIRLIEEKRTFEWPIETETAFQSLKEALCTPVQGYPRPGEKFNVDDASNVGIGSVLYQVQGGRERVVTYLRRTLLKAERKYCMTSRELLTTVKTLEHFYKYLYGQEFQLRTDNSALT